jgi:hypothetical protein
LQSVGKLTLLHLCRTGGEILTKNFKKDFRFFPEIGIKLSGAGIERLINAQKSLAQNQNL